MIQSHLAHEAECTGDTNHSNLDKSCSTSSLVAMFIKTIESRYHVTSWSSILETRSLIILHKVFFLFFNVILYRDLEDMKLGYVQLGLSNTHVYIYPINHDFFLVFLHLNNVKKPHRHKLLSNTQP